MHLAVAMSWIAGGLLMLAGVAKLTRSHPTATALELLGWTLRPVRTAQAIGAAELALGATTFVVGGALVLGLQATCFLAFTATALRLRQLNPDTSTCGCFGLDDVPLTSGHVALTAVLAVASGAAAVGHASSTIGAVNLFSAATIGWWLLPVAVLGLLAEAILVSLFVEVPRALAAAR